MDDTVQERVARGVALLDEVRPSWWRKVALDRLAMESCSNCILGQVYGNYWDGCVMIETQTGNYFFSSIRHGFTVPTAEQENYSEEVCGKFRLLAEAWRAVIRERLSAQS